MGVMGMTTALISRFRRIWPRSRLSIEREVRERFGGWDNVPDDVLVEYERSCRPAG
jgi:hypothetical protein